MPIYLYFVNIVMNESYIKNVFQFNLYIQFILPYINRNDFLLFIVYFILFLNSQCKMDFPSLDFPKKFFCHNNYKYMYIYLWSILLQDEGTMKHFFHEGLQFQKIASNFFGSVFLNSECKICCCSICF